MKNQMNKKLLKLLFYGCGIAIIILSVIPAAELPSQNISFIDKIAHFIQYFIFSLLYYLYRKADKSSNAEILKSLLPLSLIFSAGTELIQLFVEGRQFCYYDMIANFVGFLVIILYLIAKGNNPENNKEKVI